MLIWTGNGILVPLLTFAALLGAEIASEAAFGDEQYYQENLWPMALGFVVAGALVAALAKRFPGTQPRVLVDPDTGEQVWVTGTTHSFLFIPVRIWSLILFVLGVLAPLLLG